MVGGLQSHRSATPPGHRCSCWPTRPACCPTPSWPPRAAARVLRRRGGSERVNGVAGLSFNQATATHWPLPDLIAGCAGAGVAQSRAVAGAGRRVRRWTVRLVDWSPTRASRSASLCRGGFFDQPRLAGRRTAGPSTRPPTLGAPVLVLVCGGLPAGSRDLDGARAHVADAIGALVPHAAGGRRTAGHRAAAPDVRRRPLRDQHPGPGAGHRRAVTRSRRSAWSSTRTTSGGTTRCTTRSPGPATASPLPAGDWVTPLPAGVLTGRALPGDGCIDVIAHFAALAAESPVPLVIYHIPYRTGQHLSANTIRRLADLTGVVGIKYAVGGIDNDTINCLRTRRPVSRCWVATTPSSRRCWHLVHTAAFWPLRTCPLRLLSNWSVLGTTARPPMPVRSVTASPLCRPRYSRAQPNRHQGRPARAGSHPYRRGAPAVASGKSRHGAVSAACCRR